MAHKACKDWANDRLWTNYNLVVYVPLKDGTFSSATELWQLFESDSKRLSQEVAEEVAQLQGKGMMFILDGWDETPELKDESIIKKILHRRLLRKCSLLITSRPHASLNLIRFRVPDQHFEAVGLTHNQISTIVSRVFGNDEERGKKLLKEMEIISDLMNLCYIPLNLGIILHVYKQENALPHTLTGLYSLFVHTLLAHQLGLSHLDNITSLPGDIFDVYIALCQLAFEGLQCNSLIFSEKELRSACSTAVSRNHTLGLLTAFKCHNLSGIYTKYQFTHLTIQEYLAAEHLASQSEEVQTEFIVEHISNERYLVMLQFLFGVAQTKGIISNLSGLFVLLCSPEDPRRLQVLLRLAQETQQERYFRDIGTRMNGKILTVNIEHWTDYELYLLSSLIDHLQWKFSKLNTKGVKKTVNISTMQRYANCVCQLIRQRCVMEIEIVAKFHHIYRFFLTYLTNEGFNLSRLEIIGNDLDISGKFRFTRLESIRGSLSMMDAIAALLEFPEVMEYDQAQRGLSKFLSTGLCPDSVSFINMQSIQHLINSRHHNICANIQSVIQCIASGLESLHLGGFMLFSGKAALVFGAVAISQDLNVLDLSNNLLFQGELRNIAIEALIHMLTNNKSLKELGLKECELDEEVLSLIALHNKHIKILNLDCTHNFPKAVDLELLSRNLTTLYLSHCHLDDEDATIIGSMLCRNKSLQKLYLDRNHVTVGGAIHIFMGLSENKTLQYLSIGRQTKSLKKLSNEVDNDLQEAFDKTISMCFQQNRTLKSLTLPIFAPFPNKVLGKLDSELTIHDEHIKDYITRAHTICCIQYNLNFFSPSSDSLLPIIYLPVERIFQLAQNSCLEELNVSGYNLTEPSTMFSLAHLLQHSTTITHLKLFACRLYEIAYAPLQKRLFQAMCKNQSLTDLSVDPETASVLAGFVDKVNYQRSLKGYTPLTIHTEQDFYELVMRNWNHS